MSATKQMVKLNPAYSLIRKFDCDEKRGEDVLSARLDKARSTIQRWAYSKERGGTDGYVPTKYHQGILAFAAEIGVTINSADFWETSQCELPAPANSLEHAGC